MDPTINYASQAQALVGKAPSYIQPAISALAGQIPLAQQATNTQVSALQGEKQPLIDRYQGLLDQLTQRENTDINNQNLATTTEFGKRGIPISSGLTQQTLLQKTQPIRSDYAGKIQQTGLQREADLRDLATKIATAQNTGATGVSDIYGKIAQMYADATKPQPSTGMTAADFMNLMNTQNTPPTPAPAPTRPDISTFNIPAPGEPGFIGPVKPANASSGSNGIFDFLTAGSKGIPTPAKNTHYTPVPQADPFAGIGNFLGGIFNSFKGGLSSAGGG